MRALRSPLLVLLTACGSAPPAEIAPVELPPPPGPTDTATAAHPEPAPEADGTPPPSAEAPPSKEASSAPCAKAGCSGIVCVEAERAKSIVTTCEYRPEYACYQSAACEPQADGACGWTKTPELEACLAHPPPP